MPRIAPIPWEDIPPNSRAWMEQGLASGGFTDPVPLQLSLIHI